VTKEIPVTGWEQNVDPAISHPAQIWRNTWTLPLAFSAADPAALYFAHQNVFRSRDGGESWKLVSPDLSRKDEGIPSNLDAATLADDNAITRHGVVYSIAPSPLRADLIWAGTDDGYIWVTTPSSGSGEASSELRWKNVTPSALTPWSKVGIIEASHFDRATAYAAVDRHRLDDYAPYIYRTHDGGASWTAIANGIPNGSFVNAVREDPKRRGLLYAGTERGVYVSFDDGAAWQPLQLNLPVTSIRDIAVHGDDLVLATHGRSFWVMDDVAPLRQMAAAVAAHATYLFSPAVAYRVRPGNQEGTPLPLDEPQADTPTPGVYIDYYLPAAGHTPVVIEVLASDGSMVRRWSSAERPKTVDPKSVDYTTHWIDVQPVPADSEGAHRFIWDFHRDSDDGPLVPPGVYAVRLTVDGRDFTATAQVRRDPRIAATDADLRAQYELARRVASLRAEVATSRTKARQLAKGRVAAQLAPIAGEAPVANPDDSEGVYSHDFASFLFLENALDYLESAVESADAAPTPDMYLGYARLAAIYRRTLARLDSLAK
jgi:hypothetical protein